MSQTKSSTTSEHIIADNGKTYPSSVYEKSNQATGTQQEVADMWANCELPTHSVSGNRVKFYTSTDNFRGYQYPDGRGLLKHYSHIEAIRTYNGLVICDNECWASGFAHCSVPKDNDGSLPLTTLRSNLDDEPETIYDIVALDRDIDADEVEFESGRTMDMNEWEWLEDKQKEVSPLGT